MLRAVEDDNLGSNLGCKIQKGFASFIRLYNKAQVFLLVLSFISFQLSAETHLTKLRPMKQ